jgi:hypothetical protein
MAWRISGKVSPYARAGVDANGWLWEIEREGLVRRVLVEVTGTAWAVESAALPEETRDAIATEGQSELEKVLRDDDPPRAIVCGTFGCRVVTAEELAAAS